MSKFEQMLRSVSEGRIGRREFLRNAAAMGLLAAVPAGLLAVEARAQAPKRGGNFRLATKSGSTTASLAGPRLSEVFDISVNCQIRNCLVMLGVDGSLQPDLVESWEAAEGGKKWIFDLRKGVEFHNGKTLTSEDVIHSINVHRGKDSSSEVKSYVADVVDLVADGSNRVIFTLGNSNADFPYLMANYHFCIAPAGTEGPEWDRGIGTGAYVLETYEPAVRATTRKNPNYFRDDGYFESVETLNVPDVAARVSALRSGAVDCIEEPDLKTLALLQRSADIDVIETAGTRHFLYELRSTQSPYDDRNVRLAIKHGIDREALLQSTLLGHGTLGNDHPIGRGQLFFNPNIPQRTYDPEKAKWHLKQAGYDKLDLTLHAAELFSGAVDSAVLMKEHLAPAGINVDVVRVAADAYWANVWNKEPFVVSYSNGQIVEDLIFSSVYASNGSWNGMGPWKNERFDQLLVAARGELDTAKRREMYGEMQQIIHDDGAALIPVFANHILAKSKKVATPERISATSQLDGFKNTLRWWFA